MALKSQSLSCPSAKENFEILFSQFLKSDFDHAMLCMVTRIDKPARLKIRFVIEFCI